MGKRTTKTPKTKSTTEYDGTTPLPPEEERACMTIARILVAVQARRAVAKVTHAPSRLGVPDV